MEHLSAKARSIYSAASYRSPGVLAPPLDVVDTPHGPSYYAGIAGCVAADRDATARAWTSGELVAGWSPWGVDGRTCEAIVRVELGADVAKLPRPEALLLYRRRRTLVDVVPVPWALALAETGQPLAPFDSRIVAWFAPGAEGGVTWQLDEDEGAVLGSCRGEVVCFARVLPAWAGWGES